MKHTPISFSSSYSHLPTLFYEKVSPRVPSSPSLIHWNQPLADELGMDTASMAPDDLVAYFSGQRLPPGSDPLAMVYAGHQFGHFVPQLGDGRAILLGECVTAKNKRYDIQLKGCGQTRFSRAGDGLAPLGAVLREYLVSEGMYHLGVPTTRALAAVTTGDTVYREQPQPGGVITRVAASHIRIGTFEYFMARQDIPNLKTLLDYAIQRHDPDLLSEPEAPLLFFRRVGQRLMSLVAQWMGLGFIHGVMNTDNMVVSGETIDFGPCAFMDTFRFDKVFSSIDRYGRYAYDQQSDIALWNLSRLGICLYPFFDSKTSPPETLLEEELDYFRSYYDRAWCQVMGQKLGILSPSSADRSLIQDVLGYMASKHEDFTCFFHRLPGRLDHPDPIFNAVKTRLLSQSHSLSEATALMTRVNPVRIPRNHQIEAVIQQAITGNFDLFSRMLSALQSPFIDDAVFSAFDTPPTKDEEVTQTFCGT
ncbi:MAG: YdiU family protein [bacterium]